MNNLKKFRDAKNMSYRQLGKAVGINYSNLSRMEKGKMNITSRNAKKLADFFGISVDLLLGYEETQDYKKIPKIIYEDDEGKIISIDYDIFIPKQVLLNNENNTLLFVDVANPNKRRVFKLKKIEK